VKPFRRRNTEPRRPLGPPPAPHILENGARGRVSTLSSELAQYAARRA
jgi:hypothetical protein